MVTGITNESYSNMQLNAGAFFIGLDLKAVKDTTELAQLLKSAKDSGKCLGATSGGGTFVAVPEAREIEADGVRAKIKGATIFDKWDIKLTTTLKEIIGSNLEVAIPTMDSAIVENKKSIYRARTFLELSDYIPRITWIGELLDGRLVAITIYNALNISGATITFTDKGEGTLPVEFVAHNDDLALIDYAPFEIVYYDK